MIDFRYHAISLAAVLMALVIGLLLGVAIGDAELVSSAGQDVRASLREDVRDARARAAELRADLRQHDRFEEDAYPLLVGDRLLGERVGLVSLGQMPEEAPRLVRRALEDTGGRLTTTASIPIPLPEEPVPGPEGPRALPGGPASAATFGRTAGAALVRGGAFIEDAQRTLFDSTSGDLAGLDSVVLVRLPGPFENRAQQRRSEAFEVGFIEGLVAAGSQVVGVERTSTDPSQIPFYNERKLPSVDNIDQLAGRAALVFVLDGANGAYGVKGTAADGLLPSAVR